MATLWIIEYERMARDADGHIIQAGLEPALAVTPIAISGTSAAMAAVLNERTKFVSLHSDTKCAFTFAVTPVADANDQPLAAGATEFRGISNAIAGAQKIAAITVV